MSNRGGFIGEFKAFAVRGNMIDLAVGVIIGAAFGKIIDSLVKDVIMPIVSLVLGGKVDFANMFWVLSEPDGYQGPGTYDAMAEAGANLLAWGNFITILINFVLLALVVFVLVKMANKARATLNKPQEKAPAAPPPPPEEVALLREIRDLLKK
ncbi:MAG: large conductance mechanosensitive channel protein MscL [Pusillimonas sp.]|nr:large conductance mechanosensitive channel protein MscL [Pusillimonas sp.]